MFMGDNILIKIGDFLGFCDLKGVEAVQTEQVQELEEYVRQIHEAHNNGDDLVPDAIYDRLMELLRKLAPDSELCKFVWEDSVDELDDTDELVKSNPMYSIQTVKSFDCQELKDFITRLPNVTFAGHASAKLNGHGIRLKFRNGDFFNARSRARSSAGRDITKQLGVVLKVDGLTHIEDLAQLDMCEIRGEWVLPFNNMDKARQFNSEIKSPFTGVSSMGRDSASEAEWGLLKFVAYGFVADGFTFSSKSEEYEYLEELGFETPISWVIEDLNKEDIVESLQGIISDCEAGMEDYEYYTDGIVFSIDEVDLFDSLGDDGSHYKYGNIALKVGKWKQDVYSGYIQTILWKKGKTKLTPVAIVSDKQHVVGFDMPYVTSLKDIPQEAYKNAGVLTAGGNSVRKIPLYEPANLVVLDAYVGSVLYFHYGGEAGVVPCFSDGTPLVEGRVRQVLEGDDFIDDRSELYFD